MIITLFNSCQFSCQFIGRCAPDLETSRGLGSKNYEHEKVNRRNQKRDNQEQNTAYC